MWFKPFGKSEGYEKFDEFGGFDRLCRPSPLPYNHFATTLQPPSNNYTAISLGRQIKMLFWCSRLGSRNDFRGLLFVKFNDIFGVRKMFLLVVLLLWARVVIGGSNSIRHTGILLNTFDIGHDAPLGLKRRVNAAF